MTGNVCKRCLASMEVDALVCRGCHALVHADQLAQLAAGAKMLEEHGKRIEARQEWSKALALLPPESAQAAWIQEHTERLALLKDILPDAGKKPARKWGRWVGPLVAAALTLSKGKALLTIFNAKFFLSLGAFLGVYWSLYGLKFGLGFTVQILIHEFGHYVDIKRRGLPVDMPVFLPGLGAFVRWQAMGVPVETRAAISLAGPLAGFFAAAACALIWLYTGNDLWAALANTGAWLNLLNLIPVWALDGSGAFQALTRAQRATLLAISVALLVVVNNALFLLIAAGAAYRLFTNDYPGQPSRRTAAYYAAVLIALGGLVWMVPSLDLLPTTTLDK